MSDERLVIKIDRLLGNIEACLSARASGHRDLKRLKRIIDKLLMPVNPTTEEQENDNN